MVRCYFYTPLVVFSSTVAAKKPKIPAHVIVQLRLLCGTDSYAKSPSCMDTCQCTVRFYCAYMIFLFLVAFHAKSTLTTTKIVLQPSARIGLKRVHCVNMCSLTSKKDDVSSAFSPSAEKSVSYFQVSEQLVALQVF